jgi:hypothetical protein
MPDRSKSRMARIFLVSQLNFLWIHAQAIDLQAFVSGLLDRNGKCDCLRGISVTGSRVGANWKQILRAQLFYCPEGSPAIKGQPKFR